MNRLIDWLFEGWHYWAFVVLPVGLVFGLICGIVADWVQR